MFGWALRPQEPLEINCLVITWSGPAHKVHGLNTSSVGFFTLLGYPLQLHHVYPQSPFDANWCLTTSGSLSQQDYYPLACLLESLFLAGLKPHPQCKEKHPMVGQAPEPFSLSTFSRHPMHAGHGIPWRFALPALRQGLEGSKVDPEFSLKGLRILSVSRCKEGLAQGCLLQAMKPGFRACISYPGSLDMKFWACPCTAPLLWSLSVCLSVQLSPGSQAPADAAAARRWWQLIMKCHVRGFPFISSHPPQQSSPVPFGSRGRKCQSSTSCFSDSRMTTWPEQPVLEGSGSSCRVDANLWSPQKERKKNVLKGVLM